MQKNRSLLPLGLGVVLLALFAGLTSIALRDRWFVPAMDRHIAGFCDWVLPANLNAVSKVLAGFGSVVPIALLTVVFVAVLVSRGRWRSAAVAVVGLGLVVLVEAAIRLRFDDLPANPGDVAALIFGWGGWSETYPSGHTARVGLVAVLYPALGWRRVRPWWLVGAVVLGMVFGVQRVESGSHTGDEAIGGLFLGWGVAALGVACLPWVVRGERSAAEPAEQPAARVETVA